MLEQVKKLLADQLDADIETMTADTKIDDDLGADSLDVVDMLMTLEDEFGIEIPDEDIEGLKTIGDVADYIQSHT